VLQWAEGRVFEAFLREGRVLRMSELPLVNRDEYLGGVLDFTGELNRYAVARATLCDMAAVQRCRDLADALMGVFLEVRDTRMHGAHACGQRSRAAHASSMPGTHAVRPAQWRAPEKVRHPQVHAQEDGDHAV
jgi:hypothetical protein